MKVEKYENKVRNEKEEIINNDLNNLKNNINKEAYESKESIISSLSFELALKVDFKYFLFEKLGSLVTIHELSNKNLGILLAGRLIIITPNLFKIIKTIQPRYKEFHSVKQTSEDKFIDFIELNNSDIVIWTSKVILIYDKEYNLIQKIDEYEQGHKTQRIDYDYDTVKYYEINSVSEMKNGQLISCNSYGLKFYEKENNKYNLISTEKMDMDVNYIIEINPNILILLQKHYDETYDDMEGENKYMISIYNIETKKLKKVFYTKVSCVLGEFTKINYIKNKKYLFMCYGETMEIFDLENNFENIDLGNNIYEYKKDYKHYIRIMKEDKRIIEALTNYNENLFFGKDFHGAINLYSFTNNDLKVYYNFTNDDIKGVIKLTNNDIILYSNKCLLYKFNHYFKKNNIK